jgi:hypothetical protein
MDACMCVCVCGATLKGRERIHVTDRSPASPAALPGRGGCYVDWIAAGLAGWPPVRDDDAASLGGEKAGTVEAAARRPP